MSGIHRTKIDWADSTWNPVSGCLHGCEYCYATTLVRRFKPKPSEWPEPGTVKESAYDERCFVEFEPTKLHDADGVYLRSTPYPKGFAPTLHTYKLGFLQNAKTPRRIFVGSMTDLFGDWVPDEWIKDIFQACKKAPQHIYMFLTKNPQRYNDLLVKGLLPIEENFWYGGTRTGLDSDREHEASMSGHTFLNIEPLHGPLTDGTLTAIDYWEWVIIGAETGNRKGKVIPKREWIAEIVKHCQNANVPIFMKDSLSDIWGDNLIQEYPLSMINFMKN